jgi:hypothetical protein
MPKISTDTTLLEKKENFQNGFKFKVKQQSIQVKDLCKLCKALRSIKNYKKYQ